MLMSFGGSGKEMGKLGRDNYGKKQLLVQLPGYPIQTNGDLMTKILTFKTRHGGRSKEPNFAK